MMTKLIYILNGPNLNLLGKRQPKIYGNETLADVEVKCRELVSGTGFELDFKQTNAEYQLIDWIHEARTSAYAIIINAGGYSHTSVAIRDALDVFKGKIIELHISNIYKREEFRQKSLISDIVTGGIFGLGAEGYILAIISMQKLLKNEN